MIIVNNLLHNLLKFKKEKSINVGDRDFWIEPD